MNIKEIFNTMEYGPAPESNKESLQFLEKHNRKFNLFINNNWVEPDSKNITTPQILQIILFFQK